MSNDEIVLVMPDECSLCHDRQHLGYACDGSECPPKEYLDYVKKDVEIKKEHHVTDYDEQRKIIETNCREIDNWLVELEDLVEGWSVAGKAHKLLDCIKSNTREIKKANTK